jgi:hypothetical protein
MKAKTAGDTMGEHKKDRINKYHLSLAGEYRVASELLKRNLNATVTFGNAKGADVVVYGPNRRAVVVEVKTSQQKNFVTQFYTKYKTPKQHHPDFWVLLHLEMSTKNSYGEEFFILTHEELATIQARRNREYHVRCGGVKKGQRLTWKQHYELTKDGHGVDNVLLTDVEGHRDQWHKIEHACSVEADK